MRFRYKLKHLPWPTTMYVEKYPGAGHVKCIAHPNRPKQWVEVARNGNVVLASRKKPEVIATLLQKGERIYIASYYKGGSVRRVLWSPA